MVWVPLEFDLRREICSAKEFAVDAFVDRETGEVLPVGKWWGTWNEGLLPRTFLVATLDHQQLADFERSLPANVRPRNDEPPDKYRRFLRSEQTEQCLRQAGVRLDRASGRR
jgi:hypothetical protein